MKTGPASLIAATIVLIQVIGCASVPPAKARTADVCIDELTALMESKPVQTHLVTLDGQRVLLDEFYRLSLITSPFCVLPEKFYHWKHEVKTVTSKTPRGPVTHKIRIYYNYLSICRPDLIDPGKTHGDIAEFYSEKGAFMGLAVYAGEGLYCPIPYSGYNGEKSSLRYYIQNRHTSSP